MATADPQLLDARLRAAEIILASRYGRTLVEHRVTMSNGLVVRVVEYPAEPERDAALPPIVLLHGIASVNALALPLVSALPDRRILAVDWPGHGLSGPSVLPRGVDLRAHVVAVLDEVLARFELAQVDLLGHSLGAQFALYFALRRRASVRRMVLLGEPGAAFSEARPVAAMRALSVPVLGTAILSLSISETAYRARSERLIGRGGLDGYPDEITEIGYLASQRHDFAPSVASMFRALMTPVAARPLVALSHDELGTIGVPVLIVWGEHDVLLTPANGKASFDAIPGAELLEISGGHLPWLNDLDRVAAAVSAFLTPPLPRD
jgi:pimeloyl-ACP methyl ester carboxylesterase